MKIAALCFALVLISQPAQADPFNGDEDPLPGDQNLLLENLPAASDVVREDRDGFLVHKEDPDIYDQDWEENSEIHGRRPPKSPKRPQPKPKLPEPIVLKKRVIPQLMARACENIRSNRNSFPQENLAKSTQYFTPMFRPGKNGKLQEQDRPACIKMEGSCIVDRYLYNWLSKKDPWGKIYIRDEVKFSFGKGSGESDYNQTNALDPCRTLAADPQHYPPGTVIYLPAMRNKICPQSGRAVDGCFIVGDVGSAIKGKGRFDIFTGECIQYDKSNSTCEDPLNTGFIADGNSPYYVVSRDNKWARQLRGEADSLINKRWGIRPKK